MMLTWSSSSSRTIAAFGSAWLRKSTLAVFVIVLPPVPLSTVACSDSVALLPTLSVPTYQSPLGASVHPPAPGFYQPVIIGQRQFHTLQSLRKVSRTLVQKRTIDHAQCLRWHRRHVAHRTARIGVRLIVRLQNWQSQRPLDVNVKTSPR